MALATQRRQQVLRLALLLFGMYALIAARLFHVQVTTAATFSERQEALHRRLSHKVGRAGFERGRRGRIFSADDKTLALGYDSYRLTIDPTVGHYPRGEERWLNLTERVMLASDVLSDLGVEHDIGEFLDRGTTRYQLRKRKDGKKYRVPWRSRVLLGGIMPHERRYLLDIMKKNRIGNFHFEAEAEREYPEGGLVAEIVGFVGRNEFETDGETRGRGGIEYMLEGALAGSHGRFRCEKDGRGTELDLAGYWEREPEDGSDVGLTIDTKIQTIVDEALAEIMDGFPCDSVTGIVVETDTGRILAMKSRPGFGPEDLERDDFDLSMTRCRAVSDSYPPGSTFKPFVIARAIESGIVSWDQEFDTNNGLRRFRLGRHYRDLKDSSVHGVLTVREIITLSSNIGMAIIGFEQMGLDALYEAIDSFDFRTPPGVLLPNQPRGWYPRQKNAKPLSAGVSLPFGHEIRMSPLALTARFSIFGTGGMYHEPVLVDWIEEKGSRKENRRRAWRMVPDWVANEVREVLVDTVEEGTAKSLRGLPWSVAAKTGTAQIIGRGGPTGRYSSSLVALAPADESRITVYVGLYGVHGKRIYAGETAGTAVRKIIERSLRRLEVAPDQVDSPVDEEEKQ